MDIDDDDLIAAVAEERWLRAAYVGLSVGAMVGVFGALVVMLGITVTGWFGPGFGLVALILLVVLGSLVVGRIALWRRRGRRREGLPPATAPRWGRWMVGGLAVGMWFVFMLEPPGARWIVAAGAAILVATPTRFRRHEPEAPAQPLVPVLTIGPLLGWMVLFGRENPVWALPAAVPLVAVSLWQRRTMQRAQDANDPDLAITGWVGSWLPAFRKAEVLVKTRRWDRAEIFADYLATQHALLLVAQASWVRAARADAEGRRDDVRRHGATALWLHPYHVEAWLLVAQHAVDTQRPRAERLVDAALKQAFRSLRTGPEVDALERWRSER